MFLQNRRSILRSTIMTSSKSTCHISVMYIKIHYIQILPPDFFQEGTNSGLTSSGVGGLDDVYIELTLTLLSQKKDICSLFTLHRLNASPQHSYSSFQLLGAGYDMFLQNMRSLLRSTTIIYTDPFIPIPQTLPRMEQTLDFTSLA